MIRGISKTIAIFILCLTLGVVVFRLDEVWNIIKEMWNLFKGFYTQFSWEMIGTILFAGVLATINGMLVWASWKTKHEKRKETKKAAKNNNQLKS